MGWMDGRGMGDEMMHSWPSRLAIWRSWTAFLIGSHHPDWPCQPGGLSPPDPWPFVSAFNTGHGARWPLAYGSDPITNLYHPNDKDDNPPGSTAVGSRFPLAPPKRRASSEQASVTAAAAWTESGSLFGDKTAFT